MVKVAFDTRQFDAAIKELMKYSRRDIAEELNQKAYSITLSASKITYKAQTQEIRAKFDEHPELIAMAINKWRGANGLKGLKGRDMHEAIRVERNRRIRAAGFLRAGWLAAVATLASAIGKEFRQAKTAERFQKISGGANKAIPSDRPGVTFWDATISKVTRNLGLARQYVEIGLQAAMNQETRRIAEHIERKLQARADAQAKAVGAAFFR